jgi:hypothetical protein
MAIKEFGDSAFVVLDTNRAVAACLFGMIVLAKHRGYLHVVAVREGSTGPRSRDPPVDSGSTPAHRRQGPSLGLTRLRAGGCCYGRRRGLGPSGSRARLSWGSHVSVAGVIGGGMCPSQIPSVWAVVVAVGCAMAAS